jgi:DNA-binding transcriptional MerR regulator
VGPVLHRWAPGPGLAREARRHPRCPHRRRPQPRAGSARLAARARSGFTIDALRYYERIGLIDGIGRAPGGQRRFRDDDLEWLGVLRCLRETGMPIARMRQYAELTRGGQETMAERLGLLIEHDDQVGAHRRTQGPAGASAGEDRLVPGPAVA